MTPRQQRSSAPEGYSDFEDRMLDLAEAQLLQQRRMTGYLAVIAWITMIGFLLSLVGGALAGVYAATH
jgi:hypothetical protein